MAGQKVIKYCGRKKVYFRSQTLASQVSSIPQLIGYPANHGQGITENLTDRMFWST
jgi:hypothetical protein